MIDHIGITVSSIKNSKAFYRKTLNALGYVLIKDTPTSVSFGIHKDRHVQGIDPGGSFWLSEGLPIKPYVHFAFSAPSRNAVDKFFTDGLSVGGIENGAPGLRVQYHSNYYAAFLLDPDGYNIEAVYHSIDTLD